MESAAQYANTILAYRNGGPVRLSDVANVIGGAENIKLGAWANTTSAIILNVQRQPGANIIQVVDRIKALLPQITSTLPAAIDVAVLSDRTVTIRASVADVEFELGLAVILVVIVIFFFLRTLPGTIIPSLSVPLSLVGTLGVMYLLNFSLDNLSLMALTIATGFVVDDAIVMIENIARYVERGMEPLEAALRGSQQIGFTIISLTISLIAVLIPLLFMGEVVGRLFHEFAITLAVTIVISAVVSLTLVPMMCAKLIRHRPDTERTGFDLQAERAFNATIALYGRALNWVLDRQPLTLLVALLTLAFTLILYILIPKGFFPVQDTGMIQAITEASQSVSYQAMTKLQNDIAEAVLADPDVESLSSFIGVDGTNQTQNTGRLLINLKPHDERSLNASAIIRRIQQETSGIVGISLYMQPVQDLTIDFDHQPRSLQIRARGRQSDRIQHLGAAPDPAPRPIAAAQRRRQRSAAAGIDAQHRHRPRYRRPLRHHPGDGRQCALRRVRPAHHLDHLHPVEPVPRDHGGRSFAAALDRRAVDDLPAVLVVDQQRAGAAFGHRASRAEHRAALDHPLRPAAGDYDLV